MPIDPNLAFGFRPTPNIAPDLGQITQTAGQMLGLQQAQQAVMSQNALRGILGAPGAIDDTGQPTPDAMRQVMAVDPNVGMKLRQNGLVMQQQQLQQQTMKTKLFQDQAGMVHDISERGLVAYQDAKTRGLPEPEAIKAGQSAYDEGMGEARKSGLFSDAQLGGANTSFDPIRARSMVQTVKEFQQQQKDQTAAEKIRADETREAARDAEIARHNHATEGATKPAEIEVMLDPTKKDASGNPTPFSYNKVTRESTTLDGKPYVPGGVAKVGSGAPVDDKPMSDEAIAYAGTMYRDKGTLPPFGNSRYAVPDRKKIIAWAADRNNKSVDAAGSDVVTQAGVKADTASLAQTTKYRNQVESFEETAQQSAGLIRSLAPKGLGPSGIPVIDSWMQAGRRAIGNADVVKFGNAIDTFTSEYAKIMSGATGAAGSTDSARAKAEGLINKAQNAEQLYGALDVMQQEMNIRRKSLTDQEAQIRRELGQRGGKGDAEPGGDQGGGATSTPKPGDKPTAQNDAAPLHPPVPSALSGKQGLQWNPTRKQFRDSSGAIYDADGKAASAAPEAGTATPAQTSTAPPAGGYAVPQAHANDLDGTTYNGGKLMKKGGFIVPVPAASTSAGKAGQGDPLAQARTAIASGAPRDAVIKRLRENGIDPAAL